jgi:beta-glucosidase
VCSSDLGSAGGCRDLHHTSSFLNQTAKRTLESGLDIELPGVYVYGDSFLTDLKLGIISTSILDTTVARILRAKFRLGLFDHPYVNIDSAIMENDTPEQRALALNAAHQSIVLLKNENNLLPLSKEIKSIAVIGPNANEIRLGGYSGFGMKVVTVLDGIKNKLGAGTKVSYAKGCELGELALPTVSSDCLIPAGGKPGQRGLKGEYFSNQNLSGTPALIRIDKQINFDWGGGTPADSIIPSDRFSVRWTGIFVSPVSGKYKFSITTDDGVRLYADGTLIVNRWVDRGPTPDYFTMNLRKGQRVNLRIEYYENGGGASVALGWSGEHDNKKDIDKAIALAKSADVAVFVGGIIEGEGQDRADLNLSGRQEELLHELIKTRKPVVAVLMAGSAVTMANWIDDVPAIVDMWYGGEEAGNALADVLFGDYNPSGKLPITFPQSVGQCPLYYNTTPSGRGYDYVTMSGKPLFPFGHGLSYTKFEYSNLKIQNPKASQTENIHLGIEVRNTGTRTGDEVVQLYLHDQVASVVRPLKELGGFQRITLAPQESKTVVFTLTPDDFSMIDKDLKSVVEPGIFDVMIGSSSEDIRVNGTVEVIVR